MAKSKPNKKQPSLSATSKAAFKAWKTRRKLHPEKYGKLASRKIRTGKTGKTNKKLTKVAKLVAKALSQKPQRIRRVSATSTDDLKAIEKRDLQRLNGKALEQLVKGTSKHLAKREKLETAKNGRSSKVRDIISSAKAKRRA